MCLFSCRVNYAYGDKNKDNPASKKNGSPRLPRFTAIHLIILYFPTAKLLIQPPTVRTESHFHIREPFGDNGYNGCIYTNTYP